MKRILLMIVISLCSVMAFGHSREIAVKIFQKVGDNQNEAAYTATIVIYEIVGGTNNNSENVNIEDLLYLTTIIASDQKSTDNGTTTTIKWYNFDFETDGNYNMAPPYYQLENGKRYKIKIGNSWVTLNTGIPSLSADIEVAVEMNSSGYVTGITVYNTDNAIGQVKRTGFGLFTTSSFNLSDYKSVTVKQLFNNANSDNIGYSPEPINSISSTLAEIPSGKTVYFKKNKTKYLVGKNNESNNRFYKDWNNNSTKIINDMNIHDATPEQRATQDSRSTFTASMTVEGVSSPSTIKITDPWYINLSTGVQNSTQELEFRNLINEQYKVFKGVSYLDELLTPYQLQLSVTDINGIPINYLNHSAGNLITENLNTSSKFNVEFTGISSQPSSLLVNYKAHLRTNQLSSTQSYNQRRLVVDGNTQLMVYESMGQIWVTISLDNGVTWKPEKSIGYGSNPSISNTYKTSSDANSRIIISFNDVQSDAPDDYTGRFHLISMRMNYSDATGYEIGWTPINLIFNSTFLWSYENILKTSGAPVPPISSKKSSRMVTLLKQNAVGDIEILYAYESSKMFSSDLEGIRFSKLIVPVNADIRDGLNFEAYPLQVTRNAPNDNFPVLIYYPAVNGQPEKMSLYYLSTLNQYGLFNSLKE